MTFTFGDSFTRAYLAEKDRVQREKERLADRKLQQERLMLEQQRLGIARAAEARLNEQLKIAQANQAINAREAAIKEQDAQIRQELFNRQNTPLSQAELDFGKNLGLDLTGMERSAAQKLIDDRNTQLSRESNERIAARYANRSTPQTEEGRELTAEEIARDIIGIEADLETKPFRESASQRNIAKEQIRKLKKLKNYNADAVIEQRAILDFQKAFPAEGAPASRPASNPNDPFRDIPGFE